MANRITCEGRGDQGDHCCYIEGRVCGFLVVVAGQPRCSIWDGVMVGNPVWEQAPVGQFFARRYPGYDCRDWPQNIPELMTKVTSGEINPAAVCCWGDS